MKLRIYSSIALFAAAVLVMTVPFGGARSQTTDFAKAAIARGDFAIARSVLEKLDDAGVEEASYLLGNIHYFGQGVEKSINKARVFYLKAANKRYAPAMAGVYYASSSAEELKSSIKWLLGGLIHGHLPAVYHLLRVGWHSEGKDRKSMQRLLFLATIAARGGDPFALRDVPVLKSLFFLQLEDNLIQEKIQEWDSDILVNHDAMTEACRSSRKNSGSSFWDKIRGPRYCVERMRLKPLSDQAWREYIKCIGDAFRKGLEIIERNIDKNAEPFTRGLTRCENIPEVKEIFFWRKSAN